MWANKKSKSFIDSAGIQMGRRRRRLGAPLVELEEELRVEELVPGVGHAGEAPVAAVLEMVRGMALRRGGRPLPVDGGVAVLAVIGHPGDVQVGDGRLHPLDHRLENAHLRRVRGEVALVPDGLRLAVALAAGVPPPAAGEQTTTGALSSWFHRIQWKGGGGGGT